MCQQIVQNVLRDTDLQTRLWGMRGLRRRLRDVALAGAERTTLLDRMVTPRQTQLAQRYRRAETSGVSKVVGVLRDYARLPNVELPTAQLPTYLHDYLSATDPVSMVFDPAVGAGATLTVDRSVDQDTEFDTISFAGPALRSVLGIDRRTTCMVRPDAIVVNLTSTTFARRRSEGAFA